MSSSPAKWPKKQQEVECINGNTTFSYEVAYFNKAIDLCRACVEGVTVEDIAELVMDRIPSLKDNVLAWDLATAIKKLYDERTVK